jgi:hypothetical protein
MSAAPSGWNDGLFVMKVIGSDGVKDKTVDGYVNGIFALDKRSDVYDLRKVVWCMTHLPTGYAVRHIRGSLSDAFKIADEIAAGADWDFSDPKEARSRGPAVKAVAERHPNAFHNSNDVTQAKAVGA